MNECQDVPTAQLLVRRSSFCASCHTKHMNPPAGCKAVGVIELCRWTSVLQTDMYSIMHSCGPRYWTEMYCIAIFPTITWDILSIRLWCFSTEEESRALRCWIMGRWMLLSMVMITVGPHYIKGTLHPASAPNIQPKCAIWVNSCRK